MAVFRFQMASSVFGHRDYIRHIRTCFRLAFISFARLLTTLQRHELRLCVSFPLLQTLIMKQELTASKMFSSIVVFELISGELYMCTWSMSSLVRFWLPGQRMQELTAALPQILVFGEVPAFLAGKVSLDRINVFMNEVKATAAFETSHENTPLI